MLRKVPAITAFFWIVKVLTTALGESVSDYLVHVVDPVVAVLIGAVAFAVALTLQFRASRYNPWVYWFAVAMVAVFGTMSADVLHIGLGIPYVVSIIFFSCALVVVFALWYTFEKTLSIHSINTRRRELWYWLTVVTTFALGTAAGDMSAATLGLGYLYSGILFAALIAVVAFAHYAAKGVAVSVHRRESRDAVLTFWLAYILTRPLGASFADWMGKDHSFGGLGWGDGTVSVCLAVLIIAVVAYLSVARPDVDRSRVV